MATAAKATIQSGGSNSKTKRFAVTETAQTILLPVKVTAGLFKNIGLNDIGIRINSVGTDYWLLQPGDQLDKILLKGAVVEYISFNGTSTLQALFEG